MKSALKLVGYIIAFLLMAAGLVSIVLYIMGMSTDDFEIITTMAPVVTATPEEAEKITRQKNTGVVFIASVHSKCGFDAIKKDYIRKMIDEGVFSHTYSLERCDNMIKGTLNEFCND